MDNRPLMVLIDGHAMLYRAFFAFPQTLTKADGTIVNAVYGFTRILLTTIEQLKPTHMVVSFDVGKTFRHEKYEEYKAHREKMPEELKSQEQLAFDVVKALNMPLYLKDGYEADDVLGTLAMKASGRNEPVERPVDVMIVTGDMDALQLVRDRADELGYVRVYNPGGGKRTSREFDEAEVLKKLGVTPFQVADLKGLAGDSSDNIPGIYGIGPKTAQKLLSAFGNIENLYAYLESKFEKQIDESYAVTVDDKKLGLTSRVARKLVMGREDAFLSKYLATIVTDVDLPFSLTASKVQAYNKSKAEELFAELEFESLMKLLPEDDFEHEVQDALF